MNLLIDSPPKEVWIDEKPYAIRWQFGYSILYELLMLDPSLTTEEKIEGALRLYYPVIPPDRQQATEAALWFYQCGQEPKKRKKKGRGKAEQIYSFDYDDGYIYTAFLEQYGIDLTEAKDLHWWKFKALFQGLSTKCEFRKIMNYRAMDISSNMSREQKDFYKEMKELYRIPLAQDEEEKISAIEKALLEGGDLTGVL